MRPTTDLLNLKFAFQQSPLTISDFIKAFEQRELMRGFRVSDWGYLEELHRVGALVPIFRFQKNTRLLLNKARQEKRFATSVWLGQDVPFSWHAYKNGMIGTLIDPQTEIYKTWYSYIRSYKMGYMYPDESSNQEKTGSFWASSFLYSPYQLLLIPSLRDLIPQMRIRRHHRKHPGHWKVKVRLDERQQKEVLEVATENRDLAITLTALEAKYLPRLKGHRFSAVFSGDESYVEEHMAFQQSFDPTAMLEWTGWDAEKVKKTAERLLFWADNLDPLRDWYDLVRMCHPDMLNKLRGAALLAMDYRRAAEILLRFYEDLQAKDAAPQFEHIPKLTRGPFDTRLKYDLDKLNEVLMKFGLSPQPSLVLIIEGKTEEYIVPNVMKLLGISQNSSSIQIFNIQGIRKDFELLARYIVPPQLGDSLQDGVLLIRPLTHFFVAVDAEGGFINFSKSQEEQEKWVNGIYAAVPKEYQTERLRNDLDYFVHVETWGDVFEFAHFTDKELAQVLLKAHNGSKSPSLNFLVEEVRKMRKRGDNKNIEKILNDWNYHEKQKNPSYEFGREVGKIDLTLELWPLLENKIRDAISEGDPNKIPIVRVLLSAEHLAFTTRRKDVMMRV